MTDDDKAGVQRDNASPQPPKLTRDPIGLAKETFRGELAKTYSPAKCLGTKKKAVMGEPDMDYVSTRHAERQNLSIRMQNGQLVAAPVIG
jgi:hypothetical protein